MLLVPVAYTRGVYTMGINSFFGGASGRTCCDARATFLPLSTGQPRCAHTGAVNAAGGQWPSPNVNGGGALGGGSGGRPVHDVRCRCERHIVNHRGDPRTSATWD